MTTHVIGADTIYRGSFAAGHVLRMTADANYSGIAWIDTIDPNAERYALAAGDDVTFGPFMRAMPFRIDVTTGSVTVDTNYRPSIVPMVHLGVTALVDSRLSATQREAIDALDSESTTADIVAALQATAE